MKMDSGFEVQERSGVQETVGAYGARSGSGPEQIPGGLGPITCISVWGLEVWGSKSQKCEAVPRRARI